jgi:hypothetical protein
MSDKAQLLELAGSAGLSLDPSVLSELVELISLGVQPKDIAPYLRAVLARVPKGPVPSQGAPPSHSLAAAGQPLPPSARQAAQ